MTDAVAQTQRVWDADLNDAGRKLTLEELTALESMHQCKVAQETRETLVFLLMHLRSIEGRLDRFEQYLQRIDVRYPRSDGSGLLVLPNGR